METAEFLSKAALETLRIKTSDGVERALSCWGARAPVSAVVFDGPFLFLGPRILICKVRGFVR